MSIPVNALKDDELLHYAALDPGAAQELAKRIAEKGLDPNAERDELREEIRGLESLLEDQEMEHSVLHNSAERACGYIKTAMNPEGQDLTINELLKKALDCLE